MYLSNCCNTSENLTLNLAITIEATNTALIVEFKSYQKNKKLNITEKTILDTEQPTTFVKA